MFPECRIAAFTVPISHSWDDSDVCPVMWDRISVFSIGLVCFRIKHDWTVKLCVESPFVRTGCGHRWMVMGILTIRRRWLCFSFRWMFVRLVWETGFRNEILSDIRKSVLSSTSHGQDINLERTAIQTEDD